MSKEQEVNTPYHIQPHNDCVVFDDKGNSVIQTATPEHANFIVTACNSHYALKKENEELRATVGEMVLLLDEIQAEFAIQIEDGDIINPKKFKTKILECLTKAGITV